MVREGQADDDDGAEPAVTAEHGPFRIHAVAELTGVPEPTLRAWERRYGIPTPERTASGYRLYGAAEIDQVREMRRLCDEGVAAAEAAKAVLRRSPGGATASGAAGEEGAARPRLGEAYEEAARAILGAVERFDDRALDAALGRTLFLGSSAAIFGRVLSPVLVEIGNRWHAGELTVAQEHMASERIATVARDLLRLAISPAAERGVICACFADEEHEVGLLGVSLLLAAMSYRPIVLGRRTPPSAIRSAVMALKPELVVLSTTIAPARGRARELLDEYSSACGDVPMLVGGAAASSLSDLILERGGIVAPQGQSELRSLLRTALARPRQAAAGRPGAPTASRKGRRTRE